MESRQDWVRAAGVAGIVSVVLVVAGRLVAGSAPQVTASANEIASYYAKTSHWHRQEAGLILGALSMVFFLWFLGGLRARLRTQERDGAPVSSVALAAGAAFAVLYAALSTMGGVVAFALDGRARSGPVSWIPSSCAVLSKQEGCSSCTRWWRVRF
jgi:hypothetical protein